MKTDWKALCEELLGLWDAQPLPPYESSRASVIARTRAALAKPVGEPAPPAAGEVAELIKCLRIRAASLSEVGANLSQQGDAIYFTRAADMLKQCQAALVPVAVPDRLPELRGMFERILCVARSSGEKPVGNIELADRLIKAVVSWATSGAALAAEPVAEGG